MGGAAGGQMSRPLLQSGAERGISLDDPTSFTWFTWMTSLNLDLNLRGQ